MPNATPVSAAVAERARKNLSMILQRLSSVGQNTVAEGIGKSETFVSRLKEEDLERFALILALLDLKAVPTDMRCYPEAQIEAIFTLAKSHMQALDSAEKLSFEEE